MPNIKNTNIIKYKNQGTYKALMREEARLELLGKFAEVDIEVVTKSKPRLRRR